VLRKVLERNIDDDVSDSAACNLNCPPDILRKVLERGQDDDTSCFAALNPNCPVDMLREVLERGNNDCVSINASENINCPLDAKIKWMRKIGHINHEGDFKLSDDSALEEFKKMIGGL